MPVTALDLQKLKPLQGVPLDELEELLAFARERRLAQGEVVFEVGDPATHGLLLVAGRFAVTVPTAGGARPVGDVWPGEIVGESAFFEGAATRTVRVVATAASVALVIDTTLLAEARGGRAIAAMQRHVLAILARRVRATNHGLRKAWQEQRAAAARPDAPAPAEPPLSLQDRLRALIGGLL